MLCCADNVIKKVALPETEPLMLDYLQSVCPGASGLEIKDPSARPEITTIYLDAEKKFHLTEEDEKKTLNVIYKDPVERSPSPWLHVQRELPLIDSVSEFCFYLKKEVSSNKENEPKKEVKTCVTRINKRYFATFYHDLHKDFKEGNVVEIFSNDDNAFKATCKFKNTLWDFILFKSNEDVKGDGPHIFDVFYPGERIILYGRATDDGRLAPQEGIINSLEGYWDGKKHATFLMGTIKTNRGDSGGGVFNHSGLLGISVGNTPFEDFPYSQAAREAAEFNSRNYIISAKDLAAAAEQVEGTRKKEVHQPRPGPPPIVRACMGLPKKRGRPDDDTEEY
ncbi:unnamed protein product [Meloidogyne enterolobii]|uniref:Uncharacterized protein n=1 Tax=Meloidogyne enterolobii TaxID=390850 RepID=A0ACB1AFV3_MELEN